MRNRIKNMQGAAMVEYIIITVVVAVAALAVFGLFGDRIRALMGGAVVEMGGDQSAVDTATSTSSQDTLKNLSATGSGN
jgi:Flp pilus assembly pilin Flp